MAAFGTLSATTSAVDSINDLDGYTFRDYTFPSTTNFIPTQEDAFGFDPPSMKPASLSNYQPYSPPSDLSLPEWPDFQRPDDSKASLDDSLTFGSFEMDGSLNNGLPSTSTAVSRYGQMTPPRSSSAASSESVKLEEKLSPKSANTESRRKRKAQSTSEDSTPAPAPTGRKRKTTKKIAAEKGQPPEESKRKQSLEKNRLAAAKCRTNKKEKTEQLQRDSHEKAVQNAYLKDQVMRMKDEIQQMNALLLAHANCEECKAPEEIQSHLAHLGSDFFTSHMGFGNTNFSDFNTQMNFNDLSMMSDSYFDQTPIPTHPPLPDFDRSADFEVQTPLQLD